MDEHMVNVAKRRAELLNIQTEEEWKKYLHDKGWNNKEVERMLKIAKRQNSFSLFD